MRIAIDATSVPRQRAGAGTYICNLVQALAQVDRENTYFVFAKRETFDGRSLQRDGFRLVPVRLPSRLARMLWEQAMLPLHLSRLGVDVLHSPHYTTPLASAGCRRVVTFHDVTFFLLPRRYPVLRRLYFQGASRAGARLADLAIAVSETVRGDVVRHLGLPAETVRTVPLAPGPGFQPLEDSARMEAVRSRYGLPPRFILNVGTLEPGKNQATLVRAFPRLKGEGLEQGLVIAGQKGWMYEKLFRLVDGLGLRDDVRFVGHLPEDDLAAVYNMADLFVFPSLYEGFGLPPLEAMACGLPVVASSAPALAEVLDGAALLVDACDASALAEASAKALKDKRLRSRLRRQGLKRASQFSWERTARGTVAAYEAALSSTRD
ncbi:MAG: glycosyltransferase family 4 protein [Dehalococcoidia bacterium]|nr:MAG: glycosyltransferase family 4 protein [Dehalococcoidia bacterium]